MSEAYAHVWVSFDDFHEDISVMVSFSGRVVKYPHEGMNDTTVWLSDIEDIECTELMIEGGQAGDVKDYYNVFGEEMIDNLIARAEEQAEFEEDF